MKREIKQLSLEDINNREYLEKITCIGNSDCGKRVFEEIKNNNCIKDKFVWTIFGINYENKIECLQVASSKNIKREILQDIKYMFSEHPKCSQSDKITRKTTFKNEYKHCKNENKRAAIYRTMLSRYKQLFIYALNVDKYLGDKIFFNENIDADIEIMYKSYRYNFAEVKFAYEMGARYWNASGDEHRVLMCLQNKEVL